MKETLISWPVASNFGWGIRGLGYFLNWPGMVVSASPELTAELPPNDPRQPLLCERAAQSRVFQQGMLVYREYNVDGAVLVPLGNDLTRRETMATKINGRPIIACPVFEDVESVERNIQKLKQYDAVVVASNWNRDVLAGMGVEALVCHEGIDPVIFNPTCQRERSDGRFRVFSGGKAEHRKGHDLVIEAFKLFAETHDDAVLVAAWSSPFGGLASDLEKTSVGAPPGHHIGRPNFHAWLQRNGLKPHQFEIVSPRPNWQMAEIYGSCDVAIFPNRCEGGTNFVAMEAMACGVPTLHSTQFGQDDIAEQVTWSLGKTEIQGAAYAAYVADDLLRLVYSGDVPDREPMTPYWTWERHCKQMAEIVDAL